MPNTNLPQSPFDGQIFIDAFRVKWVYSSENGCWMRTGVVSDIPVASETIAGLLSSQLKNTLDGIPQKGGHFGIIARPLPTISTEKIVLFRDTVKIAFKTDAGSTIRGVSPFVTDAYKAGEYRRNLDQIALNQQRISARVASCAMRSNDEHQVAICKRDLEDTARALENVKNKYNEKVVRHYEKRAKLWKLIASYTPFPYVSRMTDKASAKLHEFLTDAVQEK